MMETFVMDSLSILRPNTFRSKVILPSCREGNVESTLKLLP